MAEFKWLRLSFQFELHSNIEQPYVVVMYVTLDQFMQSLSEENELRRILIDWSTTIMQRYSKIISKFGAKEPSFWVKWQFKLSNSTSITFLNCQQIQKFSSKKKQTKEDVTLFIHCVFAFDLYRSFQRDDEDKTNR